MSSWQDVLQLDSDRSIVTGSPAALCDSIRQAADLRIRTDFIHNEHVDPSSSNPELVNEVSEFHETCLLDNRWTAGFMTLRQPVSLPDTFGSPPSMSLFMYNQDGTQAIARPHLADGPPKTDADSRIDAHDVIPKCRCLSAFDADTNAPSSNFIYDFETFHYHVRNDWQELLANRPDGTILSGSVDTLAQAFLDGCEIKVAIKNLFADLAADPANFPEHEVFIQTGWCYYYTQQKLFIAATHPLVRVKPAIPLAYAHNAWDFGWTIVRTDGLTVKRICNPYTLRFSDSTDNHAIRWFAR